MTGGGSLSSGQRFVTVNNRRGEVGALSASDGQGQVYHVVVDGLPFAADAGGSQVSDRRRRR